MLSTKPFTHESDIKSQIIIDKPVSKNATAKSVVTVQFKNARMNIYFQSATQMMS